MAGPDKIPSGAWGGDLDPNAAQSRAQFEANLAAQQQQLAQLHQQAAAAAQAAGPRPVQVIDSMPAAEGPDASQYAIPSHGSEGGDLIGSMGADQARTEREFAKAAAATGEGPPVPDVPIPVPPDKRRPGPVGHIPQRLQAQTQTQRAVKPAQAVQAQTTPARQSALARKKQGYVGTANHALDAIREVTAQIEQDQVLLEHVLELLEAAAELQYAAAKNLKGA